MKYPYLRKDLMRKQHEQHIESIAQQYDQIRPFCPVCMVRHVPEFTQPSDRVSPAGIYRCGVCVKNDCVYPVPMFLLGILANGE